jgi:hypothetical protein
MRLVCGIRAGTEWGKKSLVHKVGCALSSSRHAEGEANTTSCDVKARHASSTGPGLGQGLTLTCMERQISRAAGSLDSRQEFEKLNQDQWLISWHLPSE